MIWSANQHHVHAKENEAKISDIKLKGKSNEMNGWGMHEWTHECNELTWNFMNMKLERKITLKLTEHCHEITWTRNGMKLKSHDMKRMSDPKWNYVKVNIM